MEKRQKGSLGRHLLKLIRVHHWIKNGFIFVPAFFAGRLFNWETIASLVLGFFAFSLMASCIYVINDYLDIPQDKLHPEKRKRPLASGAVTKSEANLLIIGLFAIAFLISIFLSFHALAIILAYFVMNLLYSIRLKHIAILDICIIAFGFLLRIALGGVVGQVFISHWLIMLTFLLSLLLGLAKRRDEYLIFRKGNNTRKSIEGYNLEFIDLSMMLTSSVTLVTYIMYTVSDEVVNRIGHPNLYVTAVFVVVGIMRYLQQTLVFTKSGSPTKILLQDAFLQSVIAAWLLTFGILIYW
ncbi:UbiA prenyltransferase family protein [Spirulina sp. CS-785/01]|uniref:UbiA prenyltransferase family protein n=1 Tax=Spirulina sp. CS-785/01 TaxID=3021716 RepID=UPI002330ACFA|nr:UbiA prenyltransferase family protein [Spirulina sp. CS-785/01]MDB9313762.1 UbiA prenyltransferase family protein [Spirulina sp. CS-785/01]